MKYDEISKNGIDEFTFQPSATHEKDSYIWKFEDVYSLDHHGKGDTIYSKAYYHVNAGTDIHSHEFYEINIVTEGYGTHIINGVKYNAVKGKVYIIPPMVKHRLDSIKGMNVFHILLNNYFMERYKAELESLSGFFSLFYENATDFKNDTFLKLTESQLAIIKNLCDILVEEQKGFSTHIKHTEIICNNLIVIIIAELSKMMKSNHLDKKVRNSNEIAIVRILDYVNSHYADKITIETLLSISFLSKTNMIKYFRLYTKSTPLKYLYQVRTNKAKEKMESGITDVTLIANECGFFDASHLNKHFKSAFGISPKLYIKQLQPRSYPPPKNFDGE